MSRYNVRRYGYDYSLTPARPTGWRGTLANITIFATVMAVSALSGAVVTLELFASSAPPIAARATAAQPPAPHATAQSATQMVALAVTPKSAPTSTPKSAPAATTASIADAHAVPPATVAAAAIAPIPAPPAVVQTPQPQSSPVADSDLTFAKGYAQRRAIARGAPVRHGKVVVEAKTNLGRTALKSKPKTYARNTNTNTNTQDDQRRVAAAQPGAFGMFQRFERPDQFDFTHHQALAFGEQRTTRRNNDAPRPAAPSYGNSPNGMFGGLF
jgi:hypothetical protein